MRTNFLRLASLLSLFLFLGCAAGNCRQTGTASAPGAGGQAPAAGSGTAAPTVVDPVAGKTSPSNPIPNQSPSTAPGGQNIVVFKYDGSQQCGMGKAVPPEEMERELRGIPVLAREKRSDGMMRIQVCGASTGMANLYTIPAARLGEAEKRGFKTWTY